MIAFVPKSQKTFGDLFDLINLPSPHTQVPNDPQTPYTYYLTSAQLPHFSNRYSPHSILGSSMMSVCTTSWNRFTSHSFFNISWTIDMFFNPDFKKKNTLILELEVRAEVEWLRPI